LAVDVVGTVTKNLHDDVSGSKHGGAISNDLCAFIGILGIGIPGINTSAGLYVDFEARLGQGGENGGHERDPPVLGISSFGTPMITRPCLSCGSGLSG
jgi:hypothetical protein